MTEASAEQYRGYTMRPDPSEPWRYRCPDCGTPRLKRRTGKERNKAADYGPGDSARAARDRATRIHCPACGARKQTVRDAKADCLRGHDSVIGGVDGDAEPRPHDPTGTGGVYSQQELRTAYRLVYARQPYERMSPDVYEDFRPPDFPHRETLKRVFGSWMAARAAARPDVGGDDA